MNASDPVSLDITLRGLLEECGNDAVLASMDRILVRGIMDDEHRSLYSAALDELRAIPPTAPSHPILLSVWWNDGTDETDDTIDVGLLNLDYVPPPEGAYDVEDEKHHRVLGMGLSPWSELIDATVWIDHSRVMELCPTLPDVLAQIVWELTFYGWSSVEVMGTRADIKRSMDEYFAAQAFHDGPPHEDPLA